MYNILWSALKGWIYWKRVLKKFNPINNDYQIMYLSNKNRMLSEYLKKYLYTFMHEKKVLQVLILCEDEQLLKDIQEFFSDNINIQLALLSEKESYNLMSLYRFGQFNPKFMYLSIDTYGRRLNKIVGQKTISEEELFAGGLFTLKLKEPGYFYWRDNWTFNLLDYLDN